jgi:hypothetical protein
MTMGSSGICVCNSRETEEEIRGGGGEQGAAYYTGQCAETGDDVSGMFDLGVALHA